MDARTGTLDLAAVAATVAGLDADVIAVQEADRALARSGGVHQVAWLGDRLGFEHAFAPALIGDPETSWALVGGHDPGGGAYGVGLLSRYPIAGVRSRRLPGGGAGQRPRRPARGKPGWDREPRVALTAVVATPAGRVRVTAAHLSYLPWRGIAQLRAAASEAVGDGPVLLLGDFNLPVAVVRRVLGRRWDHAGGAPTYPAWKPRAQPDQVAVTGGLAVHASAVGPAGSSDHLPLCVTVRFP